MVALLRQLIAIIMRSNTVRKDSISSIPLASLVSLIPSRPCLPVVGFHPSRCSLLSHAGASSHHHVSGTSQQSPTPVARTPHSASYHIACDPCTTLYHIAGASCTAPVPVTDGPQTMFLLQYCSRPLGF